MPTRAVGPLCDNGARALQRCVAARACGEKSMIIVLGSSKSLDGIGKEREALYDYTTMDSF